MRTTWKLVLTLSLLLPAASALRAQTYSGAVVAWGNNSDGQTNVPAGLTNEMVVAGGYYHSLALNLKYHTLVAWGRNDYGQSNIPYNALYNVTGVAAGGYHNVIVRNDGVVVAWGRNNYGQVIVPTGLSNVVAVAAGEFHSVALKDDGTVVAWGRTQFGLTNVPAGLSNVTAIAAGRYHTAALKSDGTVVAWGDNGYGQKTVPAGLSNVTAIACGWRHTVALTSDQTVVTWGGLDMSDLLAVPIGLSNVIAIAAGNGETMALKDDGTVVVWGDNNYGQTNVPTGLIGVKAIAAGGGHNLIFQNNEQLIRFSPLPARRVDQSPFILSASAGSGLPVSFSSANPGVATVSGNTVTITGSGATIITASQAGDATFLPAKNVSQLLRVTGMPGAVVAWAGASVTAWGEVLSWYQTNIPPGLSNVTAISAGGSAYFAVALKSDGRVVAWGNNEDGQTNVPPDLSDVVAISAGKTHTLALKSNGTVVAWGWSGSGGQTTVPIGLSNVMAVAAGFGHSVVLKTDGTVVAWGDNPFGQAAVPAGLSNVVAVAAGGNHTVALKNDGTVIAWGAGTNDTGVAPYLGQSIIPNGLSNVTAIAASGFKTVALKSDGTVVVWGDSSYGQANIPSGLSNVIAIAAGDHNTLALKRDGTVAGWGINSVGESTGIPTTNAPYSDSTNFITLNGKVLTGAMGIAAGFLFTAALVPLELPAITAQPTSQTVNATSNVTFGVTAASQIPLAYQWVKDESDLSGVTNATLAFIATNRALSGTYRVRVSNMAGTVTSSNATLRVLVPQRMESLNIQDDGVVRLMFRDRLGTGLPDDPARVILISTDELRGTNTVWTTNTGGFTTNNGYLLLEDADATNAVRRFYRVIER